MVKKQKKRRHYHSATKRTCYKCLRLLPVDRFTRRSNGTYFSACKECNVHVFGQNRRARERAAEGSYTTAEFKALSKQYDACPDCRRPWQDIPLRPGQRYPQTADHIVALSRGGTNWISNIRPLCFSCNSRKGDRPGPVLGASRD